MDTVDFGQGSASDDEDNNKAEQAMTEAEDAATELSQQTIGLVDDALGSSEAEHKNLEMVRNILFGEQARATEKKQASLERYIRVSVKALSEDTQVKINALKDELGMLADRLAQETANREADTTNAQEHFGELEQSIDRLGNQIRADQHEIRQNLSNETQQLGQQMQDWREELLARLQQTGHELQHHKTDRKTMADLLQNMAQQLADDQAYTAENPIVREGQGEHEEQE